MAKSSTILTGARTLVYLNGRRLGGARSLTVDIGAAKIATAMISFFDIVRQEGRSRIKMVGVAGKKIPLTHEIQAYVTKIEPENGRTAFHLVAAYPKGLDKRGERYLLNLIERCTTPVEKAAEQEGAF